ncbi:MAG: bifunctional DNA primase/polymerase [Planctomycetota bacterium]|jgi:hypothetical protein
MNRIQKVTNENLLLKEALRYFSYGWCVIPIKPGTKKPALKSWKKYQTERPDEKQLRKWFSDNNKSIAVVLGPVSNDLACRDFDTETEYDQWAKDYPDLANLLPTAKTSKGFHVYFEEKIEGRIDIKDAQGNHLGELRGSKHYNLLPPSIHPDGQPYEWVNPLNNGNLMHVDPEFAGFITNVTERTDEDVGGLRRTEEIGVR